MWIGIFLVCVGVLVLLSNLGIIRGDVWEYIWPLLLISLGISLLSKHSRRNRRGFIDEKPGGPHDRLNPPQP
jgi:hypothetical protein